MNRTKKIIICTIGSTVATIPLWVVLALLLSSCSIKTYNVQRIDRYEERKQTRVLQKDAYYWRLGHFVFIPTFGPILYLEKN